jgi:hypothetical protein
MRKLANLAFLQMVPFLHDIPRWVKKKSDFTMTARAVAWIWTFLEKADNCKATELAIDYIALAILQLSRGLS